MADLEPPVIADDTPVQPNNNEIEDDDLEDNDELEDNDLEDDDEGDDTEPVVLTPNERNRLLIQLDRLKWPGLGLLDLIKHTYTVLRQEAGLELLRAKDNESQILFAKRVWNQCTPQLRRHFLPSTSSWMSSVGANEETINILSDALDQFERNIKPGRDDSKYRAYLDIKAKYDAAIAKRAMSESNPFVEALTPGELRLIAKFEQIQREREPRPAPDYETHYPNQNAVTYPYILGKMLYICECHTMDDETQMIRLMEDVFKFLAVHGQKGHLTLQKQTMRWTSIRGPTSGLDIKPHIRNLIECDSYRVATEASADNKYLENHYLTLKRMIRLVHICTTNMTPWGMLSQTDAEFTRNLKEMHDIETRLDQPEKFSLAMVWYKCINRDNICTIMVDHHEHSANNILAAAVGKRPKNRINAADYAFPFTKDVKTSFGNIELQPQEE